jgi:hypothetical protein
MFVTIQTTTLRKRLIRALLVATCLVTSMGANAVETLIALDSPKPSEALMLEILKLTIEKSGNRRDYNIEGHELTVTEARLAELLKDGKLSVMWAGIQAQYEEDLIPIRIPILRGMLGHRIFIIRKGDQHIFDKVKTLEDLQEIPLGQGRSWGDTAVLKAGGMNVVAPTKFLSLMHMLEGGRFDFFPRAVHEPWVEVQNYKELNLTVEESILLIYPYAMYFYVQIGNEKLAKDIEQGFYNAFADGSYDEIFFNHPMIKDALEQSNLKGRKIFRIPNPNLPRKTPIDKKELWLDIDKL